MTDVLVAGGSGDNGKITALGKDDLPLAELIAADTEAVVAAGQKGGRPGRLTLYGGKGNDTINLTGSDGHAVFGGGGEANGRITASGKDGHPLAELIGAENESVIAAGAPAPSGQKTKGRPGRITLYDGKGNATMNLTSADGHAVIGGGNVPGRITAAGRDGQPCAELIAMDAESVIGAGQSNRPARLTLYNGSSKATMNFTSADAHAVVGGSNVSGRITAAGGDGKPVVEMIAAPAEAIIGAGQLNRPARISLYDGKQKETIRLDAAAGDILLFNADCAEEFDADDDVVAGAVVVLGEDGVARCCRLGYDHRVLGVVSGAGDLRPGILLDRRRTGHRRAPIALMGKVMCLVEAETAPVRAGDLLTTSAVAGHAMRADRRRALGTVIGKALASLGQGRDLVPVVVSLQ